MIVNSLRAYFFLFFGGQREVVVVVSVEEIPLNLRETPSIR